MPEFLGEQTPSAIDQAKERREEVTVPAPSLYLPIDDADLVSIINKREELDNQFYKNTLKLDKRTEEMENFWLGKQLDETKFHGWQVPYKDNIIWQDLEQRVAIAAGRMPQIIVEPSQNEPSNREFARQLEKALEIKITNEMTKRLLKDGLRNLHLYLRSAIKVRWDKNKGQGGDFVFELVRPHRYQVDHTATIPHDGFTADNAEIIYEWIEEPLALVINKFPSKKEALYKELGIVRGTSRQMMAKIKYREIWFTWYNQDGTILEGVCWKYKNLILGKMKNPYWDWEGYQKSVEENGRTKVENFYHNHFDRPRKPYIFLSHQNLGRSPYDDTSPVEQAIPLQRIINKRGRQITEIADRAIPKLGFSGQYITKEEARRVTNDPDEHVWIAGAADIRQAIQAIAAQPPSPVLFTDLAANRNQIDGKFATHSVTRGEIVPQESGISKQITREGDLVVSDDISSIVVERAVYEMANWATQMMKVNYDQPHLVKSLGKDGEMVYIRLTRDMIEDGMEVNVKASSVDKQTRRADALQLAARKAIDPLTLFEELDVPNPKERTKRLISFLTGQLDNYAGYLKDIGLLEGEQEGGQLPASPQAQAGEASADQQAILDIQRIIAGEDVVPSGQPNLGYVQTLQQFVASGGLEEQPPETQERFTRYIQSLREIAGGGSD
ncbi:MAG: hypothetical protein QXW38_08350 [Candidatus Nitrosotenuis sp.]